MPKINGPQLSPFAAFKERWKDCTNCSLCHTRSKVVLSRGTYPCDIVFVAEAPGISEDAAGYPMVGPAGQLLDKIISRALPKHVTYAITNMLCCIPRDEDGIKMVDVREWDDDWIEACSVRLQEFIELCDPKSIVTVGKVAEGWLDPGYKHYIKFHRKIPMVTIIHPAAILRANQAQQGLAIQKSIITIRNAVEEHLGVES